MEERVKVLLVEDDVDFAALLGKRIAQDERLSLVGCAADRESGVEMARSARPHIVVMDLSLSGDDFNGDEGIEAAKEIRVTTDAKIIFLTAHDEPETMIGASRKAFASGYVLKSRHQTITDSIYAAATSNTPEKEFIKGLVLNGLTSAEKAVFADFMWERTNGKSSLPPGERRKATGSSAKTIANQRGSILKKLSLRNADELYHVFSNW